MAGTNPCRVSPQSWHALPFVHSLPVSPCRAPGHKLAWLPWGYLYSQHYGLPLKGAMTILLPPLEPLGNPHMETMGNNGI